VRYQADDRSGLRAAGKLDTGDVCGAAAGPEEAGENSEERRFPRSVRAEQREALAIVHGEAQPADRYPPAKCPR